MYKSETQNSTFSGRDYKQFNELYKKPTLLQTERNI